jgi:tRNA pseudouridine55 synthase
MLSFNLPEVKVRLVCSKGTYIRSFARDIGLALSSGGYLSALERTAIGTYHVGNAYGIEEFQEYVDKMKP